MSFIGCFVCGFAMSSIQYAPVDVPKDHWAYSAVNELFQNRLMDGYPAGEPLAVDRHAVYDQKTLEKDVAHWKAMGLLVGYPDGLWGSRREPSRYEFAIAVYSMYSNLKREAEPELSTKYTNELPHLVRAMSMVCTELTKLGADTRTMLLDMNHMWPNFKPTFRG